MNIHTSKDWFSENYIFRVSAENAPVGIIETDAQAHCLYVNNRWCKMTGLLPEEAKGKGWELAIHPEDRNKVLNNWSDAAEIGKEFNMEFRLMTPEKLITWVHGSSNSLVNEDGEIIGHIGTMTDITERVQAENAMKELARELMRNLDSLEQFKYIISHDLKSPVRNMVALLSFYNKKDPTNKNNKKIIINIEKSAKKLQKILNELIKLSDIGKSKGEIEEEIKFADAYRSIINSIGDIVKHSKAKIKVDFSNAPTVKYVNVYLHSILLNLITNSIKYKSPKRKPVVNIRTYKKGKYTCLEISDNGIGMDLEKNGDRVFGLFQRFNTSTEGKGLGLYIIKTIIEANGGMITLTSEPGKGSVFTVSFKNKK